MIFEKLDETWKQLKPLYKGDFKTLVYDELPKDEFVLSTLNRTKQ